MIFCRSDTDKPADMHLRRTAGPVRFRRLGTDMKEKRVFYTEAAYFAGLVILALGTSLMEKADLGLSMVVAPAYLLHLKISKVLPFYTFGVSEYVLQAILLVLLCIVLRRPKKSYLFSFVTAVLYGLILDLFISLLRDIPGGGPGGRLLVFFAGLLLGATGVSMFFHTYISPEAYELVVKEICEKYSLPVDRVKTAYDCSSCAAAILLSFVFFGFGRFEGVKGGTIFEALINGWLIGRISRWLESRFEFRDALALRKHFEQ